MNTSIITGKVVSDIKIINTKNGHPFCRFTLLSNQQKFNCLIAGKKSFNFLYEVSLYTDIAIQFTSNDRNQLVVQKFKVLKTPAPFNSLFEYKGRKMPHKKVML
ncbi:ssDNA-binding protein [Desemzia incerta]|uniref:ssDNA-binding protein n=1 Tax=Desemzia incerta TaxID=82801 RepID=UPI0024C3779A|nr:ssDNA-binding protein [Desemzia incerta]WHZ31825.1 ssDNA-binding protein [Desemzia incerta]